MRARMRAAHHRLVVNRMLLAEPAQPGEGSRSGLCSMMPEAEQVLQMPKVGSPTLMVQVQCRTF